MTRHEGLHPHQSEKMKFLPKDYIPYRVDAQGKKIYGVIVFNDGQWKIVYQNELPAFGGYLAKESIYGSPTYCSNATRLHRQHQAEIGSMPHLVFFNTEESAQQAGFRACKKCLNK